MSGTIVLTMYSALPLIYYNDDSFWFIRLFFFSRGFAEWIFIIGVYGVMRLETGKQLNTVRDLLQRAGHSVPFLHPRPERASHASLPDPPAGVGSSHCSRLLGASPQSVICQALSSLLPELLQESSP